MPSSGGGSPMWKRGFKRGERLRNRRPSRRWRRFGRTRNAMIEVRALHNYDEFVEAVRLQRLIWGFEEVELLPVRLFVTASKIGGQVFGAFDQGRMIGFCLAIPGIKSKPP